MSLRCGWGCWVGREIENWEMTNEKCKLKNVECVGEVETRSGGGAEDRGVLGGLVVAVKPFQGFGGYGGWVSQGALRDPGLWS